MAKGWRAGPPRIYYVQYPIIQLDYGGSNATIAVGSADVGKLGDSKRSASPGADVGKGDVPVPMLLATKDTLQLKRRLIL